MSLRRKLESEKELLDINYFSVSVTLNPDKEFSHNAGEESEVSDNEFQQLLFSISFKIPRGMLHVNGLDFKFDFQVCVFKLISIQAESIETITEYLT